MKKQFEILRLACIIILVSPFVLVWIPFFQDLLTNAITVGFPKYPKYADSFIASFQQLSITLVTTVLFAATITMVFGYLSILSTAVGKITASVLEAIESIPAILIALFFYAPVSGFLASSSHGSSSLVSLVVFILAATITCLPESVRGIALPLGELYHRKYSLSFRSYGFTRSRILVILMNSTTMRDALRRTSTAILLKTLVLDTSFGFIIQLGFGSEGTPAHASPGALIAANDKAIFPGGDPLLFWLPVILLVMISMAFLLVLGNDKEETV